MRRVEHFVFSGPSPTLVQERLTKQIAAVIMEVLKPTGCGVIVEAK